MVGVATACNDTVATPPKQQSSGTVIDQPQIENIPNDEEAAKSKGASGQTEEISGSGLNANGGISGESQKTPPPSEETKQETIKVFYTDPEELEVKSATRMITFKSDWGKYKSAFKALQHSDSQELIPLWSDEITLNKLEVKNGNITFDLHIPATANLGSGGEQFAIDAIKDTFFQFGEVKSLELLVDGEQRESLMGHVDLEHPMTRDGNGHQ
ncbi:GerMN domain-containing protein [Paenibacillus donghaensis]|nr:GerMN domain-containing protein [Paenibacillus donghaensis]